MKKDHDLMKENMFILYKHISHDEIFFFVWKLYGFGWKLIL